MSVKRKAKKPDHSMPQWRFMTVVAFILLGFVGLVARTGWIQIVDPDRLRLEGDLRSLRTTADESGRGMVTDRNGEQLAVSVPVQAVWADPKVVHESGSLDNTRAWQALAEVLGLDVKELTSRIADPRRRFVYLQRQITPSVAEYVSKVHAICVRCGNLANYSHRKIENEKVVVLGEKDIYEPLCRSCYKKAVNR